MRGGGEHAHVQADLGDDLLRADAADTADRQCCVDRSAVEVATSRRARVLRLQGRGERFEGDAYAVVRPMFITELVVAAAEVLHEGVPGRDGLK